MPEQLHLLGHLDGAGALEDLVAGGQSCIRQELDESFVVGDSQLFLLEPHSAAGQAPLTNHIRHHLQMGAARFRRIVDFLVSQLVGPDVGQPGLAPDQSFLNEETDSYRLFPTGYYGGAQKVGNVLLRVELRARLGRRSW